MRISPLRPGPSGEVNWPDLLVALSGGLADADPRLQILRGSTSATLAEIEDYPTGSSASTVELKVWLPEGHLRQDRRRAGPQW